MKIFVIKDIKAGTAAPLLYTFANEAVARRTFQEMKGLELVKKYPSDFECWCLGDLDQVQTSITAHTDFCFNFAEIFTEVMV